MQWAAWLSLSLWEWQRRPFTPRRPQARSPLPTPAGSTCAILAPPEMAQASTRWPSTALLRQPRPRAAAQCGFPAGTYACYTIRLKSHVGLHLDHGATILAASVPDAGTTTGGYDAAGPAQPWEAYQDYGHNHWPNSLVYGDGLEDISITGMGLIWGKGLSRGEADELPRAESPGVANKAIALKNCHNVTIQNVSILMGGHFAILLTGVDNVLLDGLKIDTNRDGIDIDCCRNVRVSNCAVNSPGTMPFVPRARSHWAMRVPPNMSPSPTATSPALTNTAAC